MWRILLRSKSQLCVSPALGTLITTTKWLCILMFWDRILSVKWHQGLCVDLCTQQTALGEGTVPSKRGANPGKEARDNGYINIHAVNRPYYILWSRSYSWDELFTQTFTTVAHLGESTYFHKTTHIRIVVIIRSFCFFSLYVAPVSRKLRKHNRL